MKCKFCGGDHHIKFHLKENIPDQGFPTNNPSYAYAHKKADEAEKKNFPKDYEKLKKYTKKAGHKHVLLGKNKPSGEIEVSSKVPSKFDKEIAFHEKIENEILKKIEKRKKNKN